MGCRGRFGWFRARFARKTPKSGSISAKKREPRAILTARGGALEPPRKALQDAASNVCWRYVLSELARMHGGCVRDRKRLIECPSTVSERPERADARGTRRNVIWGRYECVTARGRRLGVWTSPPEFARTGIGWTFEGQFLTALETENVAALRGFRKCVAVPDLHLRPGGDFGKSKTPPRRAFFARWGTIGLTLHGESDATVRLSVRAVCAKLCALSPEPHR